MLEEEKVVETPAEEPAKEEAPVVEAAPSEPAPEAKEVAPKEKAAPSEKNSEKPANSEPKSNEERRPRGDVRGKGRRRPNAPRPEEPKEFEERAVYINRVAKTVKGGRRMKFTALVVIGNHKGKYGFGFGKAAEVPDAIKKATDLAKKNIYTIPIVKGNTIPHEVIGHFGASKVYLKPAPEGTGVIAGGPVRAILELAGIQNVCSKVYGSRTPVNVIRAAHEGLSRLTSYKRMMRMRSETPVVEEPTVSEGGKEE